MGSHFSSLNDFEGKYYSRKKDKHLQIKTYDNCITLLMDRSHKKIYMLGNNIKYSCILHNPKMLRIQENSFFGGDVCELLLDKDQLIKNKYIFRPRDGIFGFLVGSMEKETTVFDRII